MIDFETEIRVYKARYLVTDQYFADLLGITRVSFWGKRNGKTPFTAYELFTLSDTLGVDPRELYESFPEVNRHPKGAVDGGMAQSAARLAHNQ